MMELWMLAAVAAEQVVQQGPTPVQVWGPYGAVIVALGGPKAVGIVLGALKPSNGNVVATKFNKELCDERHDEIGRRLTSIESKIDTLIERKLK